MYLIEFKQVLILIEKSLFRIMVEIESIEVYKSLRGVLQFLAKMPPYSKAWVTREYEDTIVQAKELLYQARLLFEKVYFGMFPNGNFREIP
jgi:hypothetical protein